MSLISLESFIRSYSGRKLGVPWNSALTGECVSLVQQYTNQCLGWTMTPRGNAKDWAYNYPSNLSRKVTGSVQRGDILVYTRGTYGHIVVADGRGNVFEQNNPVGGAARLVAQSRLSGLGTYVIIRPNTKPPTDSSGNGNRIAKTGTFIPNRRLAVSGDTTVSSPALAHYEKGQAIKYDSYCMANGYAWISYIAGSGNRRYVAVGPDDGKSGTVWGTGFFDTPVKETVTMYQKKGTFIPNRRLAVSGDTKVSSPALAYYEKGQSINYDSYCMVNGYAWISYVAASGYRRYVAVGPDDGKSGTVWGKGFFN